MQNTHLRHPLPKRQLRCTLVAGKPHRAICAQRVRRRERRGHAGAHGQLCEALLYKGAAAHVSPRGRPPLRGHLANHEPRLIIAAALEAVPNGRRAAAAAALDERAARAGGHSALRARGGGGHADERSGEGRIGGGTRLAAGTHAHIIETGHRGHHHARLAVAQVLPTLLCALHYGSKGSGVKGPVSGGKGNHITFYGGKGSFDRAKVQLVMGSKRRMHSTFGRGGFGGGQK